jgi:hypothetical protein
MNLYKAMVNGEVKYKKAKTQDRAERALRAMALHSTGRANITDIKLVKENVDPRRAETRRKERLQNSKIARLQD